MKKNLISIMILALLIVNVVLTAVMMFSVMGSAKKTTALVDNIATVLNLELDTESEETDDTVAITDSSAFDISDSLTIPLKKGEDGKDHYCMVTVSLYMNTKHEDYATYSATVSTNASLFKSIIIDVISGHTMDECSADPDMLKAEILSKIQEAYGGSTFIYMVAFSSILYQ